MIEDLIEKEESFASSTVKEKTDKENAEEVRLKAMERMGQTKKRKGSESDETAAKTTKRCAQPLIDFLQEKASAERELRQAELALRKEEQKHHQDMMKLTVEQQQQQQQMNRAFLTVFSKLLEK